MRVAAYIAQRLAAEGITHAFLIQGAANNDLIYAIAGTPGINYVCAQHEQAAGFMAEGWAQVSGKLGLALATSGPGGQNLVTAIANCWYESVPCLFITGQVRSPFMRPEGSELRQLGFQETPITDIVRPITKRAVTVRDPQAVPYELERALRLCMDGRRGPVLLDLPIDVQQAELLFNDPNFVLAPWAHDQRAIREAAAQFVRDWYAAKRPAVLVGGGARGSEEALRWLADVMEVPIFTTWNALDVFTADHQSWGGCVGTYGGVGRNFGIQNCDLLLALGTRVSGRLTGGKPRTFARAAKRYLVNNDAALLDPSTQPQPFHVNVLADVEEFLATLRYEFNVQRTVFYAERVQPLTPQHDPAWRPQVFRWRDTYDPVRPEFFEQPSVHPYAFARKLSELAPENAAIITDCGGNVVTMNHAFRTKHGQRYFSNNGNSPMGFSFAAAIGAWFAAPQREVICVIGDGGFQLNIQELQTLVTYGAQVKVFILNNGCYGITRAFQETHYGGRLEASAPGSGYSAPDFTAICAAYGITTQSIGSSTEVEAKIEHALAFDGPLVCDVECFGFCTYEPRITGWATPIEDMAPSLPREEFRANMIIDPLPGWEKGEYK